MKADNVNAIATGFIAFVTFVVAMIGFYYNLQTTGMRTEIIIVFELVFMIAAVLVAHWLKREVTEHE